MEGKEQAKVASSPPLQRTKDGSDAKSKIASSKQSSMSDVGLKTVAKEGVPESSVKKEDPKITEEKPKSALPEASVGKDAEKKLEAKPEDSLPGPSVKKDGRSEKRPKDSIPGPPKKKDGEPEKKSKVSVPGPPVKKRSEPETKSKDSVRRTSMEKDGKPVKKPEDSIPGPSANSDRGRETKPERDVPGLPDFASRFRETARKSLKRMKNIFPKQFESEEEPKPLQLLSIKEDHTFELNDEEMSHFLLRDEVKDLHVVIVSVAGAFRKGKSFLLDFFLRYLKAQGAEGWMGDENSPLTGFVWRGGAERNTSGILVWNEIFKVRTPSGDVGVILMDTQGSFDSGSTVRECATIFALSTMTSSVQVYNLSQNIQEDDLQHLQLFTEYGRLAISEGDYEGTPFQKLVFLVRDWSYPYEARYGIEGGKELLERRLEVSGKQHEELQLLREHIRSCFASIDCFLLPHPGLIVATAPQFDGASKDIDKEFLKQLEILVPHLLAPENLTIKEINGRKVTCKELLEYIRAYVKVFGSNELPEPKSILVATAEANNLAAVAVCREHYSISMEEICGGDQPYMNPRDLEAHHVLCRESTRTKFEATRKMGGEDFSQAYLDRLLGDLDEMYSNFQKQNERKNIFTAMKTPACLMTAVMGSYFASTVFNLFRIYFIANLCTLVTGFLTSAAVAWGYIKYSGDYRYVGQSIDQGAELLYGHVLRPLGEMASPKLMEYLGSPQRRSESESPSISPARQSSPRLSPKRNKISPKPPVTPGNAKLGQKRLASRPANKR